MRRTMDIVQEKDWAPKDNIACTKVFVDCLDLELVCLADSTPRLTYALVGFVCGCLYHCHLGWSVC